jgi:hypothetical protein
MKILIFVMMVEHSPHHHKDEGSSPANTVGTWRHKMAKMFLCIGQQQWFSVDYSSPANTAGRKYGRHFLNIWAIFFHNLISLNLA